MTKRNKSYFKWKPFLEALLNTFCRTKSWKDVSIFYRKSQSMVAGFRGNKKKWKFLSVYLEQETGLNRKIYSSKKATLIRPSLTASFLFESVKNVCAVCYIEKDISQCLNLIKMYICLFICDCSK